MVLRPSDVMAEFEKGVGKDPRSRLDEFEAWLRPLVEREAEEAAAPKTGKGKGAA